jgi:hypothetical protein
MEKPTPSRCAGVRVGLESFAPIEGGSLGDGSLMAVGARPNLFEAGGHIPKIQILE